MGNTSRVEVGRSATNVLGIADKMVVKHVSDGESSPLLVITDVEWPKIVTIVPQALAKHREAETYRAKAEAAYRDRDLLLEPIDDAVRRGRTLLKTIYAKNPKVLADWGFEVNYTAATKNGKGEKSMAPKKSRRATAESKEVENTTTE